MLTKLIKEYGSSMGRVRVEYDERISNHGRRRRRRHFRFGGIVVVIVVAWSSSSS
jgi:hypothetical protein